QGFEGKQTNNSGSCTIPDKEQKIAYYYEIDRKKNIASNFGFQQHFESMKAFFLELPNIASQIPDKDPSHKGST
uniref:Uncharacterized protein n=1 Tax=Megaselia scalaris TaxID=36166 RepID=T1H2T6_MEGSC